MLLNPIVEDQIGITRKVARIDRIEILVFLNLEIDFIIAALAAAFLYRVMENVKFVFLILEQKIEGQIETQSLEQ